MVYIRELEEYAKLQLLVLYALQVNEANAYNTRSYNLAGKLPVGPICSPTIDSIKAVLNPDSNDYFFFVADKNGNTYFTKTYQEHTAKVAQLKKDGLWYTYENQKNMQKLIMYL